MSLFSSVTGKRHVLKLNILDVYDEILILEKTDIKSPLGL